MTPSFEKAFLAAVLAFSVFLGAILLLEKMPALLEAPTIFVALLAVPLLVFIVGTGSVSEITGPGGWGAKFREVAGQPVQIDADIESVGLVRKSSLVDLRRRLDEAARGHGSIALQLELGTRYNDAAILQYLREIRRIDPEPTIVFVDTAGRFRASTDALSFGRIGLETDAGDQLAALVKADDLARIAAIAPLSRRAMRHGDSNADALRIMLDHGVNNLVVTDETRRPIGVVKRDKIVARLMAELAKA